METHEPCLPYQLSLHRRIADSYEFGPRSSLQARQSGANAWIQNDVRTIMLQKVMCEDRFDRVQRRTKPCSEVMKVKTTQFHG